MTRRTVVLLVVLALAAGLAVAAVVLARRGELGPLKLFDRPSRPMPTREEIRKEQPELARAAVVALEPVGTSGVSGTATLVELESGDGVRIDLELSGLPPGLHGLAVFELGDCASPGAHFNPERVQHAGPSSTVAHAGDLGNVVAAPPGRTTSATLLSRRLSMLPGPKRVTGRALVVTSGPDDMVTQPDGQAGAALACGVIEPAR